MGIKFRQLDSGDFAIFSGKPKIGKKYQIHLENVETKQHSISEIRDTEIDDVIGLPFIRISQEEGEQIGLHEDHLNIVQHILQNPQYLSFDDILEMSEDISCEGGIAFEKGLKKFSVIMDDKGQVSKEFSFDDPEVLSRTFEYAIKETIFKLLVEINKHISNFDENISS